MNKSHAVTASLQSIYQTLRQVFPPYLVVNSCTNKNRVVVDVIDYVADWIWAQDITDWETTGGHPQESYVYSRFTISQELMVLMALRWAQ